MNSKSIIIELSKRLNREEADVLSLIDGLAVVFRENLIDLKTIAIPGFGEFVPVKTNERVILNSESGKKMLYPPQIDVEFNQSTLLRKKITKN